MRLEGLIGQHLGRYQIEALIGRGGMAAVYRAFDPALQRNVALKVLYPQYLADPSLVERFRREAITAASLDHPYIAPIYDVGEADGLVYLAMKLLPGPSLAELLQREGRMPLARVAILVSELASALEEAHAHGIVHRDIKPGNVLFDARGRAMLTDFGIAKSLDSSSLTESSVIVGTPDYIAPEQIDARLAPSGHIDGRADIYALGAVLYRTITGRRPFDGSAQNVLLAHLQQEPAPPSSIVPELPAALDAVIGRALAKHPDNRYASAGELARDFAAATGESTEVGIIVPPMAQRNNINTRTTTQVMPAPIRDTPPVRRRSPLYLALGVLAALVVLSGIGMFASGMFPSTAPPITGTEVEAAESTPEATATLTPDAPTATVVITVIVSDTAFATTEPTTTVVPTSTIEPTTEPTTPPAATRPAATARAATARPEPTVARHTPTRTPQRTPSAVARTVTPSAVVSTTTPTDIPESTEEPATALPTTTATPIPPTPTNTPEPTATEPIRPTIEPELPPTDTPAFSACPTPLEGGFGALWRGNQRVQDRLGCPSREETSGAAAEQIFETGTMYWWSDNQQIYVLVPEVGWSQYANAYSDGEDLGDPLAPPTGLFAPERGFGKVWRTTPAVENALGWARAPEVAMTGVQQRFLRGVMLYSWNVNGHGPQIYVLFNDGSFEVYPDPSSNG